MWVGFTLTRHLAKYKGEVELVGNIKSLYYLRLEICSRHVAMNFKLEPTSKPNRNHVATGGSVGPML